MFLAKKKTISPRDARVMEWRELDAGFQRDRRMRETVQSTRYAILERGDIQRIVEATRNVKIVDLQNEGWSFKRFVNLPVMAV